MRTKQLPELLVHYVNWRSRYVGQRPRAVIIEEGARHDRPWRANSAAIEMFLAKVQLGDDLTPHLSLAPRTRGYAASTGESAATVEDKWLDKDFLLNTTGYHHFHLGLAVEPCGHAARTDHVVFAEVTRESFKLIAVFDHRVFVIGSPEQLRLAELHGTIWFRGLPPGSFVLANGLATSGHTDHAVRYAGHCSRLIRYIEPKLDDPSFMASLYNPPEAAPRRSHPDWMFCHLDLAIYDKAKPGILIVQKGWN